MSWRLPHIVLAAFLLIGLFLRVDRAMRHPRLVHPDEVFQTEEPAHRLAYGYGVVTWEWRLGIRSWVFPAILAGVMRGTGWLGAGSSGYLLGIATALSLTSLTAVWFGFVWAKQTGGLGAAIIAAGACTVWYELVIFASTALTEVVAAHLLLPGLYLGAYAEEIPERRRMFLAGILCGTALSLRIQLTPAVAFAAFCFCRSNWRRRPLPLTLGILVPIVVFAFVDMFTWSYPLQSFVRYFWVNVVEGRSEVYGTQPWYWYLEILLYHLGPMAILAVLGARRSPFLGGVALIVLASHTVLRHKEVRFLYPVIPIVVTLASLGIVQIAVVLRSKWEDRPWLRSGGIAVGLAFCTLTSGFLAPRFSWWPGVDGAAVLDRVSRDSTVCGLGVYQMPWFVTGGYTHLHRPIPIFLVQEDSELDKGTIGFNVLVTGAVLAHRAPNFQLVDCVNDACMYRREGTCTSDYQGLEINEFLRRTGN